MPLRPYRNLLRLQAVFDMSFKPWLFDLSFYTNKRVSRNKPDINIIFSSKWVWHSMAHVKTNKSRLLTALIVIGNSAFNCDRNFWNLKTWRHKSTVSKLLVALIVIKKFGLSWQEFLKLEDMKTQTVWCQNFWLLSLG